MQDIYAFDVGDYGKLALLRALTNVGGLSLGVLWWRTNAGSNGEDGKHISYLTDEQFAEADRELLCQMRDGLRDRGRRVEALEPLLPDTTVFHRDLVPWGYGRYAWFRSARALVKNADLVFCDPDNGIGPTEPCRSVRHIGFDEIASLWSDNHSFVIYHHLNRTGPHQDQITSLLNRFRRELPGLETAFGAWFRRGSSRVFFVLPQRQHREAAQQGLAVLTSPAWSRHFVILSNDDVAQTPVKDTIGVVRKLLAVRDEFRPSVTPRLTRADGSDSDNGKVSVVLNDNGGLNLAANRWLVGVSLPCQLRVGDLSFTVVRTFAGRSDMFLVKPSALMIAQNLGFNGQHLSKAASVTFVAEMYRDKPAGIVDDARPKQDEQLPLGADSTSFSGEQLQ